MIRPEHLLYFKDLLEGRADISWNAWFRQNEQQLSQELPRMVFLQLKFHKLDEAERMLKEAGIDYTISPQGRCERRFSMLAESILDEKGRPKESFMRKAYGGAGGHFMDNRIEEGRRALESYLTKLKRRPAIQRAEELGDFCYNGEMEFELGNREFGKAILELISAMPIGDDLLDPMIFRARELLAAEQS